MKDAYYRELVKKLKENFKIINDNGIEIMIKEIPDKINDINLDPRVYKEKSKVKKPIILENGYTYKDIPVEEMRLGMGWPNIDISNNVVTSEKLIPIKDNSIRVKIYRPKYSIENMRCMIFIHGGGFFGGSVDVVENPCKLIAEKSGSVVISIDYSLAPEHKFPQGLNECHEVIKYVYNNANEFKIDKNKISIAGDSAGGNLALVCSIKDKCEKTNIIKYITLLYPLVNLDNSNWSASYYKIPKDDEITYKVIHSLKNSIEKIKILYLSSETEVNNPEVSPLLANDLSGLPKTLIITAEYDFLRIQGEELTKKLIKAKVDIEHIRYRGMDHAFLDKFGYYPQAEDCITEIVDRFIRI